MARKIRFEAIYPYAPEQVWVVLTDPVALGEWLMPNDFSPVIGHRFQFRTKPAPGFDGIVNCEVLEMDSPRRLVFSWVGGGIDTIVSFDLAPHGSSTRMVMEQTGFTGMRGLMVSTILKGGWRRMVEQRLPAAASRVRNGAYHPDPEGPLSQCHTADEEN
jgi:uncharacterized protein YndB with AHSA1/START domain